MLISSLLERVRSGPTMVSAYIDRISGAAMRFWELVDEYLPEMKSKILQEKSDTDRIIRFMNAIGEKYGLPMIDIEYEVDCYENAVFGIPIKIMGWTNEDYHEFEDSTYPERQLLMAITMYPFTDGGEAAQLVIHEQCAKYVGQELISRIPKTTFLAGCHSGGYQQFEGPGWSSPRLRKLLKGTKFEGAADFAAWLWGDTNCCILNVSWEDIQNGYNSPQWSELKSIAEQWKTGGKMIGRIEKLEAWLKEDMKGHFKEMLEYILKRHEAIPEKEMLEERVRVRV